MALTLTEALSSPKPCRCQCHQRMSVEERTQGVVAMMRFDDAVRGWGYQPLYEPRARFLFDEAKRNNDTTYRAVAVKDEACNYARLVGFAVHEIIHGMCGEIGESNWGVPWGLPYGVPEDVAAENEAEYLEPYNFAEACAWAGIDVVAKALFDIEWPLRGARDVGTYGFVGGNAICPVPPGFRQVPHIDRQHSPDQYYRKARVLEAEARAFMDEARLAEWRQRFEEGEAAGKAMRDKPFPDPRKLAAQMPSKPGRNEPCICGSGQKYKRCCGR